MYEVESSYANEAFEVPDQFKMRLKFEAPDPYGAVHQYFRTFANKASHPMRVPVEGFWLKVERVGPNGKGKVIIRHDHLRSLLERLKARTPHLHTQTFILIRYEEP